MDIMFVMLGIPTGIFLLTNIAYSRPLQILPKWSEFLWAVMLLVGCTAWLIGIVTTVQNENNEIIIRQAPIMIFGLRLVGTAALVYGLALIVIGGWSGFIAAISYLTVAGGTYVRSVDLIARL
jgi:CHASE2 domain-containing sensor protein